LVSTTNIHLKSKNNYGKSAGKMLSLSLHSFQRFSSLDWLEFIFIPYHERTFPLTDPSFHIVHIIFGFLVNKSLPKVESFDFVGLFDSELIERVHFLDEIRVVLAFLGLLGWNRSGVDLERTGVLWLWILVGEVEVEFLFHS
jgi:hypothetical protein